ncbi:MAG: hypothetical protein NTX86_00560 [Candidatus Dependentiae bacterium]|nr:hypothetical protein [Candidatus Dependentiae bacterium]
MKKQILYTLVISCCLIQAVLGTDVHQDSLSTNDLKEAVIVSKKHANDSAAAARGLEKSIKQSVSKMIHPLKFSVDVGESTISSSKQKSVSKKKNNIYLGSAYNNLVINEDESNRFLVVGSVYSTFCSSTGFDDCHRAVPLSQLVFSTTTVSRDCGQKTFPLRDIWLFGKLAEQGKVSIDTDVLNPVGNVSALATLAGMDATFFAYEQEVGANVSFIYKFYFNECENIAGYLGLNIPVICRRHELDFQLSGRSLVGDEAINYFFSRQNGIRDFFIRSIMNGKPLLEYEPEQSKFGFGDIQIFGSVDFAPALNHFDTLQCGINLSMPFSASGLTTQTIWPIILSNRCLSLDVFGNVTVRGNQYLNPTFYLTGSFNFPFSDYVRIQAIVSSSDIRSLASFIGDYVYQPFIELDSTIVEFADLVVLGKIKLGSRAIAGFGNYFYAVDNCEFRFGIFYDYMIKGSNTFYLLADAQAAAGVKGRLYDSSAYKCKQEAAHRISWHAAYKFKPCGEIMVGSNHVVAGKNTVRRNDMFITFAGTF